MPERMRVSARDVLGDQRRVVDPKGSLFASVEKLDSQLEDLLADFEREIDEHRGMGVDGAIQALVDVLHHLERARDRLTRVGGLL